MAIPKLLKAGSADAGAIKQTSSTTSTPKNAGTETTKTSTTLAGNKNFQFGGVTNGTLSASLKKTSGLKTGEIEDTNSKAGAEAKQLKDIEDSSVFESAFKDGTDKAGTVLSALTDLSQAADALTNPTTFDYAKQSYNTATMLLNLANSLAANSDWAGATTILEQAVKEIENAENEAKKAGATDKELETNITVQKQVINAALERAKTNAAKTSDTTDTSGTSSDSGSSGGCSGGGCSGSSTPTYMPYYTPYYNPYQTTSSTPLTDLVGATGEAFKNIKDGLATLFGGKPEAPSKPDKASSGKAPEKTAELKYDKNSPAAKEIEKTVKPDFDAATKEIADCNSKIPAEEAKAKSAQENIDKVNDKIDKIGGEREEMLEDYNTAKDKQSKNESAIAKQDAIIQEQGKISEDLGTKLEAKTQAKETKSGEVTDAKADLDTANGEMETAQGMPEQIPDGTDEDGNPIMKENPERVAAIAKADAHIKQAKLDLQNKEAELKALEDDIKDLTDAKEKADDKVSDATKEKESLEKEKEKLADKMKSLEEGLSKADKESQDLKKELDAAYKERTEAQSNIEALEAKRDAAEQKQDLAQDLADNVAEKSDKLPWYDFSHGSLQEKF